MGESAWVRQTAGQPAFPDLLWSQPQNKRLAGKLLIIGGSKHGFAAIGEAYQAALDSGVGVTKVLLPDALQKTIGQSLEAAEFAPSTTTGSFKQKSLEQMLSLASWADGVLLAGELGRNAETAAALETFTSKYKGLLIITKDAVDCFNPNPQAVLARPDTSLVLSLAQLQRLAKEVNYPQALTFSMGLMQLVEWLQQFSQQYPAHLITRQLDNVLVASGGQVSSTKVPDKFDELEMWRVKTAARAATWWLQNPSKPFKALTTALVGNQTS